MLHYPPSPPSSNTTTTPPLRLRTVISYRGALNRGNTLLYLPRQVRDLIYTFSLTWEPQFHNIEVPDTKAIRLPDLRHIDHVFYYEVTGLILRNAVFTIPSDVAIYNLFVWLNEWDCGKGYGMLTKLELLGLDLFEKDIFTPNGTKLLRSLPNLRYVELMIDLRELAFTFTHGYRELDVDAMARTYDIASLAAMPLAESVRLTLKPFMALEKRLKKIEQEHEECGEGDGKRIGGLETFWGLKDWLEARSVSEMEVLCPNMEELFGKVSAASPASLASRES